MAKIDTEVLDSFETAIINEFYHLKHCNSFEDAKSCIQTKGDDTSIKSDLVGSLVYELHNNDFIPDHL